MSKYPAAVASYNQQAPIVRLAARIRHRLFTYYAAGERFTWKARYEGWDGDFILDTILKELEEAASGEAE